MNKIIETGTDQLLANFNDGIITLTLNNPRYNDYKKLTLLRKF